MKHLRTLPLLVLIVACKSEPKESAPSPAPPQARSAPAQPGVAPAKPVEAAPVEAPPFTSTAGRFTQRVTFGAPTEKTMDDPNGGTWHSVQWNTPSGLFMVQYTDYASHAAAVAETHGFIPTRDKASIKRDDKLAGREGRELEWQLPSGATMWIQFLIDGKRVYKVGAGFKGDRGDAQKFIAGFSIDAPAK